jgi:hypothetical protein
MVKIENLYIEEMNYPFFNKDEWKFIPDYEERYIINKEGVVKSLITNKILEDNYNEQFEQSYKSVKLIDKDGANKTGNETNDYCF